MAGGDSDMFFFIAGVGPRKVTVDPKPRTCPNCGRPDLRLHRTDQYLSVFFLPLFRVGKGEPFLGCAACGAVFTEEGGRRREDAASEGPVCPSCGRRWEENFKYCPECGNLL